MLAEVEQPNGSFDMVEMGEPGCDKAYCDTCGDCLHCYEHGEESWCRTGGRWVIYLSDIKNPHRK